VTPFKFQNDQEFVFTDIVESPDDPVIPYILQVINASGRYKFTVTVDDLLFEIKDETTFFAVKRRA
jgi:hypothetical protein